MTKNKPVTSVGYNIGIYFTTDSAPNGDIYIFNKGDQTALALLKPIIVKVTGNFGYLSICAPNQYNGGQNLFSYAYSNPLNLTNLDFTGINGNTIGKPLNSYNIIKTDLDGNFVFTDFNGNIIPYNSTARYIMTNGTYVFFNLTNQYITFMTKNKPVKAFGSVDYSSGTAPNGDIYTFYKSQNSNNDENVLLNPIIVKVTGKFGYLSICTQNGYNGGENLLYYE